MNYVVVCRVPVLPVLQYRQLYLDSSMAFSLLFLPSSYSRILGGSAERKPRALYCNLHESKQQ
ncbi:hypothetical protein OUZ56_021139 [Daphnia magna]|uniref:Uncharacterized protein n=1 Tax=Daphnia magna TaxID=35525 RepID=A0ABQ9ZGH6_9CRUS|nr:hypothetical protein OUZ56_021139 [Daphnia magna]